MIPVYSSVQINNEKLEHHGQVGTAQGNGSEENTTQVKFDGEDELIEFKNTDLRVL